MKEANQPNPKSLNDYFANYRERKSVLSIEEASIILSRPNMVRTIQPRITKRSIIIMTTFVAGTLIVGLLHFFISSPAASHQIVALKAANANKPMLTANRNETGSHKVTQSITEPKEESVVARAESERLVSRGDSDKGTQLFTPMELSKEDLAHLGIQLNGDVATLYIQRDSVNVSRITVAPNRNGLGSVRLDKVPNSVKPQKFFPMLVTDGTGRKYTFRYSQNNSGYGFSSYSNDETQRRWLETTPKQSGLSLQGLTHISRTTDNGKRYDTVIVTVGKDIPLTPKENLEAQFADIPQNSISYVREMADYLVGNNSTAPNSILSRVVVRADTMTYAQEIGELNEEDSIREQRSLEILKDLGKCVPVAVRTWTKSGALSEKDFIFWYDPSDAFIAALAAGSQNAGSIQTDTSHMHQYEFDVTRGTSYINHGVVTPSNNIAIGAQIVSVTSYPNPTSGKMTVHVELKEARQIEIRLRDLTGKEIKRVPGKLSVEKGASEYKIDAGAMREGVYLLDVETDQDERAISRIAIVR